MYGEDIDILQRAISQWVPETYDLNFIQMTEWTIDVNMIIQTATMKLESI